MTKQERLIVSAYTGVLMCDFSEFQIYVEQLLQRPVFTHELAMADVWQEIKEKSKPAFLALCQDEADREIESCNTFFDMFVIRLKKK